MELYLDFIAMKPKIYTYKITFEEVPYWYWGAHKEKKPGETYWGSPVAHKWVWQFYTPRIQILEFFDDWEQALRVEKRLISQDLNNPWCLNEHCGGHLSLESCRKGGEITGRRCAEWLHSEKNEEGKSLLAVNNGRRNGRKVHEEKNEEGKSVWGVKNAKKLHSEKNEEGKSVNAVKGAEKLNAQVWESTVDGFRSGASQVAYHNRANGWDPAARVRIC